MYSSNDEGRAITSHERLRLAGALCIILLTAVMAAHCAGCAGRQVPDRAPTMSDPAVARLIVSSTKAGGGGKCTAWKASEDLLITAGHCCEADDPSATYVLEGSHAVPGGLIEMIFIDDKHDICVLRGHMIGRPILLAHKDPDIGDTVWTAGYPRGTFLISSGYWSGRRSDPNGRDGIEYSVCSVVVKGGASGSPVLDTSGLAVGVVVAGFGDMDSLTFAAPLEWVRSALQRARLVPVRPVGD